jgi:hypothetical protein
MNILYSLLFFKIAKMIYVIIGIVFMILGVIHLADWIRIRSGSPSKVLLALSDDGKGKPFSRILGGIVVIILAVGLNAIATLWPSNANISLQSNYVNVPGERAPTLIMLSIYNLMLVVPLILAMILIFRRSSANWMSKAPSKAKSILSSFLLGLGFGLVYIFH